jgi:hypothetical protein
VSQGLLDAGAALVGAGCVDEVLSWAEKWAETGDPALVRHLWCAIVERAGPPYSIHFARTMLRLLGQCGFKRGRLGTRDWAPRLPLLAEFAAECTRQERGLGLSPKGSVHALLKELQSAEQLKKI